jgi:hypothetical protein
MTFVEVGTYIFDVEKILYIQIVSLASIDIYFTDNVKIRITGQDTEEFLKYMRETK